MKAGAVEQVGEAGAHELTRLLAEQGRGGGIRLDDSLVGGVDDDDRLGGQLEQKAIAFFRVADARVFALHRLLGLGQSLLQRRHGPEVAPNGDDTAILAVTDRAVADGNVRSLRGRMIDLTPSRNLKIARFLDHFLDFRLALDRDRIGPAAADPVAIGLAPEFLVAKRDIANNALAVHHQRDIGGGNNQRGGGLWINGSKTFIRRVEAGQRA